MIRLYGNAFSPFSRKVRMVLEFKGLPFEEVDALLKSNHATLGTVNPRAEVPALVDEGLVVVNSADIVAYLEHRYPQVPVLPSSPAARVHARAWERAADTFIDPILVNISYWQWAERGDAMPDGLLDAARADLGLVYDALEQALAGREYVSGLLSIADIALFPHLASTRVLDVSFSAARHPGLARWFKRLRAHPLFVEDARRTRAYMDSIDTQNLERKRIFWRGDRIEWMLARGFDAWLFEEINQQRVLWPGPALPAPLQEVDLP